jgi:hypothetical protein
MTISAFRLATVSAALAASFAIAAPAVAEAAAEPAFAVYGIRVIEPLHSDSLSAGDAAARPVELVAFDYPRFFNRAHQLGLTSQDLRFTMQVDGAGKVTECKLARDFRNVFTERDLCRKLVSNIRLEPARDGQGNAVPGTFEGEVAILSYFTPDR